MPLAAGHASKALAQHAGHPSKEEKATGNPQPAPNSLRRRIRRSSNISPQGDAPTVLTQLGPSAGRPAFLLDLFCGTAGVAAQFQVLGGRALGVDHHLDRSRVKAAAVPLDLTEPWVQDMILAEIKPGAVDAILMARGLVRGCLPDREPVEHQLRRVLVRLTAPEVYRAVG